MPRELIVSPRGEAEWAKVFEPDGFEDNPKAWSVSLLLDSQDPETIQFVERLENCFKEFHGEKAKVARYGWPFRDHTTKDENGAVVPTGKLEIRFKRNEFTAKGNPNQAPIVMDAKKQLWPKDKLIGNGSVIKVAFAPFPWEKSGKGMSLDLCQVQVLKLVEYSKDVDLFEEEEGYVLETPASTSPFESEEEEKPTSFAEQLKKRAAEVQAEAEIEEEIPF
jgi:hypothetical protein